MFPRMVSRRLLRRLAQLRPLNARRLPKPIRGFVPHAALTLCMAALAATGVVPTGAGGGGGEGGGVRTAAGAGTPGVAAVRTPAGAVQFSASGMLGSLIDALAGTSDDAHPHTEPPVVRMTRVLPAPASAPAMRPGTEVAYVVVRSVDGEVHAAPPATLGEGWGSTCREALLVVPDDENTPLPCETLLARPLATPRTIPPLPVRVIN